MDGIKRTKINNLEVGDRARVATLVGVSEGLVKKVLGGSRSNQKVLKAIELLNEEREEMYKRVSSRVKMINNAVH